MKNLKYYFFKSLLIIIYLFINYKLIIIISRLIKMAKIEFSYNLRKKTGLINCE